MQEPETRPRVLWKLALVLFAAVAVLTGLLGTVGAISDCNDQSGGLFHIWFESNCRAGTDPVPTSLFFIPPLFALMALMAWRKLKRSAG